MNVDSLRQIAYELHSKLCSGPRLAFSYASTLPNNTVFIRPTRVQIIVVKSSC